MKELTYIIWVQLYLELLGGELDRSILKWDAGQQLYEVALKAVEKDRIERYLSVEEFFLE